MRSYLQIFFFFLVFTVSAQDLRLVVPVGHTERIEQVLYSPDSKRIISYSSIVAKLWDVYSGKLLVDLKHKGHILSADYSSDGTKIITSASDSSAKIWNAQTGELLFSLQHKNDYISLAKFSPDGKKVMTTCDSTASLWEVQTGKLLYDLKHPSRVSTNAFFFPNGDKIAVAHDSIVSIWDTNQGRLLTKISVNMISPEIHFEEKGERLLLSSSKMIDDSIIQVYDLKKEKLLLTITGTAFQNSGALFSLDGKFILGRKWKRGQNSNTLNIWEAQSGRLVKEIIHDSPICSAQLSADGKNLITYTYCEVNVWEMSTLTLIHKWDVCDPTKISDINLGAAQLSGDGTNLVVGLWSGELRIYNLKTGKIAIILEGKSVVYSSSSVDSDRGKVLARTPKSVEIWDLNTGNLEKSIENVNGKIYAAKYYPNNQKVIISKNTSEPPYARTLGLEVWDLSISMKAFDIPHENVEAYTVSNDSKLILTSSFGKVKIWDAETGDFKIKLELREEIDNEINAAVFSDNAEKIVAFAKNSYETPLGIWDVKTGKWICDLKGPTWAIQTAHFSSDGKKVAVCSNDFVGIWDSSTGNLITELKLGSRAGYSEISPDGKILATTEGFDVSDTYLSLWEVNTGKLLFKKKIITNLMHFSEDSKFLITTGGGADDNIFVWNTRSGESIHVLKGHNYEISSIQFMDDGERILSTSFDNTCILWDLKKGEVIYTFLGLQHENTNSSFGQIPDGYFQASHDAAKMLHYVTKDLKVITFDQLDLRYNRPDKVLQAIGNQDTNLIQTYKRAYEKRILRMGVDTTLFNKKYSVPEADFFHRATIEFEQHSSLIKLKFMALDSAFLLDRFNLWINEVPVYGEKGFSLRGRNLNQLDTIISIQLSEGVNRIEVSVTNINAVESFRSPIYVTYIPKKSYTPKTHFIGMGIDKFNEPGHDLSYSVKDVRDLSKALKEKLGDELTIDTLFNQNVSLSNVQALKKKLMQTNINDKVIISYSGHGLLNEEYDYFLSAYNVDFRHPQKGGIPYEVLEDLLDSIPARKKLLLIDACHSGEVDKEDFKEMATVAGAKGIVKPKGGDTENTSEGPTIGLQNSFQLMQELFVNVQKGSGATIISAAAGDQFALEGGKLENGFFTYAILQYMKEHKEVGINDLKKYVYTEVEKLSGGMQKPTSRIENLEMDWRVW